MRVRIGSGLLLLNLLVIVLATTIIFFSANVLRIILGLPFVLFFPGYTLLLALFPDKGERRNIERIALSFGLSITVVPLIGFILNYTWWGITLESMICSITSFIFAMSIIAWVRRKKLRSQERFDVEFQLDMPGWGVRAWDKVLSVALLISILVALGTLGYAVAGPKSGEKFTEFYILGPGGKAAAYPWELGEGETGKVVVGIVNHERRDVRYRLEIKLAGTPIGELGPVMLEREQKWEREVDITPVMVGDNQKVEFLLFEEGQEKPRSLLHLWLDVKVKR